MAQVKSCHVVSCGGFACSKLAEHEGAGYGEWLCREAGVTALVLQYRLPGDGYRYPAPLEDTARAIRTARAVARTWPQLGLRDDKVRSATPPRTEPRVR
jgi:hypothetical protein